MNEKAVEEVLEIDIDKIVPNRNQPRKRLNQEALKDLANSIKEKGLLQPIVVRHLDNGSYEILAGERRWRACQLLNLKKIQTAIRNANDEQSREIALVENIQREDLSIMEEVLTFQALTDHYKGDLKEVARATSKKVPYVEERLALLNLPPVVQTHLDDGKLSLLHAKVLLSLNDPEQQVAMAARAAKYKLSANELKASLQRKTKLIKTGRSTAGIGEKKITYQRLSNAVIELFDALDRFDFSALLDKDNRERLQKQLALVKNQVEESLKRLGEPIESPATHQPKDTETEINS